MSKSPGSGWPEDLQWENNHEKELKRGPALKTIQEWLRIHVTEFVDRAKPEAETAVAEIIAMLEESDGNINNPKYKELVNAGQPVGDSDDATPPAWALALRYLSGRAMELYKTMVEGQVMKVRFIFTGDKVAQVPHKTVHDDGAVSPMPTGLSFVPAKMKAKFTDGKFIISEINFEKKDQNDGVIALEYSNIKIGDELPLENIVIVI